MAVAAAAVVVLGEHRPHGVLTFPDGDRYEGEWRNNHFHGRGVYTFPDGRRLAGEFGNGVFQGQGIKGT